MAFPFFRLPPELRIQVYDLLLEDRHPYGRRPMDKSTVTVHMLDYFDIKFLCINKQMSGEFIQTARARTHVVFELKPFKEPPTTSWLAPRLRLPDRPSCLFDHLRFLTVRLKYTTEDSIRDGISFDYFMSEKLSKKIPSLCRFTMEALVETSATTSIDWRKPLPGVQNFFADLPKADGKRIVVNRRLLVRCRQFIAYLPRQQSIHEQFLLREMFRSPDNSILWQATPSKDPEAWFGLDLELYETPCSWSKLREDAEKSRRILLESERRYWGIQARVPDHLYG